MQLAGRLLDLSKQDQINLQNGINLPYGEVKKIIRKIDPLYGECGTKNFKVEIDQITKKIQTATKTISIEITANNEEEARDIGYELADKNLINFDRSVIEIDQDRSIQIEYCTIAREVYQGI